MRDRSKEEDILHRKQCKDHHPPAGPAVGVGASQTPSKQPKKSYKDFVTCGAENTTMSVGAGAGEVLDGDVSDDDVIEERDKVTRFGMRMTREEKIAARRAWRNSLIIKLVERTIGYQCLWKHIQAMWRTQSEPMLIDLSNNYFIVNLYRRKEYERACWTAHG